ncbi:recombinase family protein [Streptomyces sp. NPDC057020]|uniref:recombinase family protein n=1 Tax=unclassified Streptomyces TaxID=2593676 RepID=UPI003638F752
MKSNINSNSAQHGTAPRTVLYLRQSRDVAGTELAVARQRQDCLALAARQGWEVTAEYVDNDVSASSGKDRPEYERLLRDFRANRIERILVWHIDRLYRQPRELEDLVHLVEHDGLVISAVQIGDIDLSTPAGRMVARVGVAIARHEAEQKGARQSRAKRQAAELGLPPGGRRAFGYAVGGQELIAHEAQAVRLMFEMAASGRSLSGIAKTMTGLGYRTPQGNAWHHNAVRGLLLNARYAGTRVYQSVKQGQAMGDVFTWPGTWPVIIDRTTFGQVQAILTDPGRRTSPSNIRKHLLSGLARCGVCADGTTMTSAWRGGGYGRCYACRLSKHVMRVGLAIDEYVTVAVTTRLSLPDASDLLYRPTMPEFEALRAERNTQEARLSALLDLFTDGEITKDELRPRAARLREVIAELDRNLAVPERADVLRSVVGPDAEKIFRGLPLDQRCAIINVLAEVTIHKAGGTRRVTQDNLTIRWKGPDGTVS